MLSHDLHVPDEIKKFTKIKNEIEKSIKVIDEEQKKLEDLRASLEELKNEVDPLLID